MHIAREQPSEIEPNQWWFSFFLCLIKCDSDIDVYSDWNGYTDR